MADSNFSGLAASDSLTVGAAGVGTPITQVRVYTVTINPASIAAATSAEQTQAVTGITTADKCILIKPTLTAGVGIVNVRASAADQIAITWMNATAGAVDPPSESYTLLAFRS